MTCIYLAGVVDASLARAQDPHSHVQGECSRTDVTHLLSDYRHRHLRVACLLRRAHPVQSDQRLHVHPGRTVVGYCDDDDRRLRRYDAEDLRRNVRRVAVRADRCPDDSASGSGDRIQLRAVLLSHAGSRQATQEATESVARRGGETESGAAGRASPAQPASQAARDSRRRPDHAAQRWSAGSTPTQLRQTRPHRRLQENPPASYVSLRISQYCE